MNMRVAPRFLVRLLAIAFVIGVGAGTLARAPHALRGFTDIAADVVRTRAPQRAQRTQQSIARATIAQPAARAPEVSGAAVRAPDRNLVGTRAWPTAHDVRQVLALKRARLI
jgi:hypothetical protein